MTGLVVQEREAKKAKVPKQDKKCGSFGTFTFLSSRSLKCRVHFQQQQGCQPTAFTISLVQSVWEIIHFFCLQSSLEEGQKVHCVQNWHTETHLQTTALMQTLYRAVHWSTDCCSKCKRHFPHCSKSTNHIYTPLLWPVSVLNSWNIVIEIKSNHFPFCQLRVLRTAFSHFGTQHHSF